MISKGKNNTSMEKESSSQSPHILVLPFPGQGHINPLLAFSKCLSKKGLNITVIMTKKIRKSAQFTLTSSINIEEISDGSEDVNEPESIEEYFTRFKRFFSRNLSKLIDEQKSSNRGAKLIVYDSTMPWVLDIAHEKGMLGASFFTQSCAVCAVYYHLYKGSLKYPYEEDSLPVSNPCLSPLEIEDLPSFAEFMDPKQTIVSYLADQFSNIEEVDWIFFNSFDKLENEIINWMTSQWPIKTIGPTFSLQQSDDKIPNEKNHMISVFGASDESCKEWLDSRSETNSVLYISFGSLACLGKEQMEELAYGLMTSNLYFLWVVRSSEQEKLPTNFTSLVSERGLIVNWCSQPQVLAHPAVSCFMTHCGWNSTLEALSCGVPLVAWPQWVDQTTNAKFIEDVWNVGVRIRVGENGVVERGEIARCVREVVEGDKGKEMKSNACKWEKLAKEAVEEGGSSDKNVDDFVIKMML